MAIIITSSAITIITLSSSSSSYSSHHRCRLVPLHVLKVKVDEYISAGLMQLEEKDAYVEHFERMQGVLREHNVHADESAGAGEAQEGMMTTEELKAELQLRERLLQTIHGASAAMTAQWRVYSEIIAGLQDEKKLLRIVIQASAGTGKSFLLETVYLWCIVHKIEVSACAPTGIHI